MQTTIRTVHSGAVRGRTHEHGSVFYGVPYAQGPTGAARFAPPVPHPGWSGIRDATRPGPTAPQSRRDSFGSLDMSAYFGSGWRRGADYLTVDVWAPGPSPDLVPVMVFVHGGGFLGGNSAAALYDGTSINRDSVVLVTVNYRLGPAGFLHLSNAPDNRGMLDVAAAVRWVADNITEFGGDPTNITLFGQSAGATVVSGVLTDPYSGGLARRAILQSSTSTITGQQASLVTAAFTAALDRGPDAQALGEVSDDQLVAAVPALLGLDLRAATEHDPLGGITPFSLVLDHEPGHRMMEGVSGEVDLLIGSNSDEGRLYLAPFGEIITTTAEDLHLTAARFTDESTQLVEAYRAQRPMASLGELRAKILGDCIFGAPTRRMATAHADTATAATFAYEFTWSADALDGTLGACHVIELPFVFDQLQLRALAGPRGMLGTAPVPAELASRVHRAWIDFATAGNPGWAPHTTTTPHVQSLP